MNEDVFVYSVDEEDVIASVSENWELFAYDNAWASNCKPEDVVGNLLWDFIQDAETRHLYKEIFYRVRTGKRLGPIPFRCDSPQERRFLELLLMPISGGQIEISSTIVRRELRAPVDLLDSETPRSNAFVRICSMCKKIAITENEWFEIEAGLQKFKLFEAEEMPGLTHGLCPACYTAAMAEMDK